MHSRKVLIHLLPGTMFSLKYVHMQLLLLLECSIYDFEQCVKGDQGFTFWSVLFNHLKPELNPICYLLALLGAHHFLHVSRIRVKLLTLR